MKDFAYSVTTSKAVDEAVRAVQQATATHGFRVLHTHDISGTLAEKGFARAPLKLVEICNAKAAHEVLEKEIAAVLMLPCPIAVYAERGQTRISTMLPTRVEEFFPGKGIEAIAAEVEKTVIAIVEDAAR
jgi:uncharacterized protein (DUF302 family)